MQRTFYTTQRNLQSKIRHMQSASYIQSILRHATRYLCYAMQFGIYATPRNMQFIPRHAIYKTPWNIQSIARNAT